MSVKTVSVLIASRIRWVGCIPGCLSLGCPFDVGQAVIVGPDGKESGEVWFAWGRCMSREEASELAEILDDVSIVRVGFRSQDGKRVESYSVTVRDSDALELLPVLKGAPHSYHGV